jgi:23S rRNA (pseudouridine1915-N3)-methyltransferase
VRLRLCWISKTKEPAIASLTAEYVKRISRYAPTEAAELPNEAALLKSMQKPGRTSPVLVLTDSRGKQFSSEEFADFLRQHQHRGTQELVFAIGPADGWSESTLKSADTRVSFGKMTLAHELARIVLLEQIYRAWTILSGHPYHSGH